MRAIAMVCLVACYNYIPAPQGPRVVCDGGAVVTGNVVWNNTECQQLPADRCWNDNSEVCREEAEERDRANAETRHRAHRDLAIVLILDAVALGVVILATQ
jgi:hypothetical protein